MKEPITRTYGQFIRAIPHQVKCYNETVAAHPSYRDILRVMTDNSKPRLTETARKLKINIGNVEKRGFTCSFRQDNLAMALLPSNSPLPLPQHVAAQTTGKGNCLFNAVSLALKCELPLQAVNVTNGKADIYGIIFRSKIGKGT